MDVALGLAVIAVIVGVLVWRSRLMARQDTRATTDSRLRADIDSAVTRDYGPQTQRPELQKVNRTPVADHSPPPPSGRAVPAWSPRTRQLEVAGEWYRAKNLRSLFAEHGRVSESGDEIRLSATLVPDSRNPHDSKAVAVFVAGLHVGYMERADAQNYHRHIEGLPNGELLVASRQWMRATTHDTWARVTLSLPQPDHLRCPNPLPVKSALLPPGSTIQVTREEQHMEHLTALLGRYGSEVVIAATMRAIVEQRPRSSIELVAVDVDGRQVGVLSTTQTANFLPLVRRGEALGRTLCCRATLRGNSLKADVALHARKTHELNDDELIELFA